MRSAKGCIRRRGPNRWWVSKPGPVDPETGKRTEVGVSVRGSRVDAAIALAVLIGESLPSETTWEAYYRCVVEPSFSKLSERTAYDYRRLWNAELKDRIGGWRVCDLSWRRANDVLTDISAPTVQRYAGRFLKKMCNMAIRDGLLQSNPVRGIEYAPHRKRPKRLVDSGEVVGFLEAIRGCPLEPLVLCELGAGMRPEEARALLWEDISPYELKGSVYAAIEVRRAITTVGGKVVYKDVKNESSSRVAVMGEPFASRLLELMGNGPLCPSDGPCDPLRPETWYMSPSTIVHVWERLRPLPVTEENMRSSYASMMGEAMVPDSVVEGNMGHSPKTTKTQHYQRVTMRAKCMAADMLAESLEDFGQ